MYQFPTDALTKNHKLSGLKQCKFVFLQFCPSEVQHVSHWAKIKGIIPFWRLEILENLFSCLFHLLEAAHLPWLMAPSTIFKVKQNPSYIPISLILFFIITSSSSFLFWYLDSAHLGIMPFSSKIMLPVLWLHFSWRVMSEEKVIKVKGERVGKSVARRQKQRQMWAIEKGKRVGHREVCPGEPALCTSVKIVLVKQRKCKCF